MSDLPLIVFDVNETLLDLDTMAPTFERIFDDKAAMRLWFANLIMYSAALTVAGQYVPFTDIGAAVMKMLADTRGIKITDSDKKELTEKFSTMPPHPEVPAALRKLRAAGFRLFTLTDNLLEVQSRQLEHAGIVGLFERRFSADGVKHHKPAPEAYGYVVKELGVRPSQLCLIACHTWDTLGAVAAGWEAALIRRPGNDVLAVGPQPQIRRRRSGRRRRSTYHAAHREIAGVAELIVGRSVKMSISDELTIVLAHGAWADGSSWEKVIRGLRAAGVNSVAAPLPLTSLTDDVAALERTIERVAGPVVLVGHAYAGAVIAGTHSEKVKALVYVAALAPEEGETVADVFYRTDPHPKAPKLAPDTHGLIWLPEDAFPAAFAPNASADEHGGAVRRAAAACGSVHQHKGRTAAVEGPADLVPAGRGRSHDRLRDTAVHGQADEGRGPFA